jgi:serine/threonine protein kinase
MPLASAESLVDALRGSGLLPPAEVERLAHELAPFGDDPQAAVRRLIELDRVPVYQLRKVLHGRTDELFVGPFVVLDKLGEGGMGKVFKCRDVRSGRLAAVKVVRQHLLSNAVVRGRYDREVKAALSLRHPNIAAAYEAGEVGGKVYLAMEFVDGIDLSHLVRTYGLLPVPEACEYLRQTALALAHAHARGLIHRDIKPGNIVVAGERHHPTATEPAVVKLLDMGLVRRVGIAEVDAFDSAADPVGKLARADLTRAGTVVGTPDYMAPEQAKNSSLVDHRADLYSLGGAFYFLLTGQPPFADGSPIEKIIKHQTLPPPPLQAVRPDVPDDLARLVAKLLAKDPDDRVGSAAEVAAALEPLARFTSGSTEIRVVGRVVPGRRVGELAGASTGGGAAARTIPTSSPGDGSLLTDCSSDTAAPPPAPAAPVPVVLARPERVAGTVPAWTVWLLVAAGVAAGAVIGIAGASALLR